MSRNHDFHRFQITEKHYNTLIKQGYTNLPKEAGGFLGGNDEGLIQAILPVFNQHLYDKTGTFAVTSEDIERAHHFFKKNNLIYYSVYHTHPKGVAYPSDADIKTGHPYHFIISYQDEKNPVFAAYKIDRNTPISIPLEVISDKGFTSTKDKKKAVNFNQDREQLNERISNIIHDKPNIYDRLDPLDGSNSDFSTLA